MTARVTVVNINAPAEAIPDESAKVPLVTVVSECYQNGCTFSTEYRDLPESERIDLYKRVLVGILVSAPCGIERVNRIKLNVSAERRVIVAEAVIAHSAFGISILAGEAEVVGVGADAVRVLIGVVVSEGEVVPCPDILLAGVLDDVRRIEPVGGLYA